MKKFIFSIFNISSILLSGTAQAHVGHIGDLAGHSHWIGLGAVVVAGAIAVAVGKFAETKPENDTKEEDETAGEEVAAQG